MSVSQASETDMQVKSKLNDKQAKNGDEQMEGVNVSDTTEFTDPAILAVRSAVMRYSREELIGIRNAPMSKRKPDFLDISEVPNSILDPEKWNLERKKSDTPTDNGPKPGDVIEQRGRGRSSGDARERIRKENDGIVLSPQRRSFNTGCFVPVTKPNRAHSPLGKNETAHIGVREIQPASRRIGSGRIMRSSDWNDYGDKTDSSDAMSNDYGFRRQNSTSTNASNDRGGGGGDEKFNDRRSFNRDMRDFDMSRDKDKDGRRNGNGGSGRFDRRRVDSGRDEEPEWFSGGPISQNDTIELRGFEDSDKPSNNKMKRSAKRAKEWAKKKFDGGPSSSGAEDKEEPINKPHQNSHGRNTPVNHPPQIDIANVSEGENKNSEDSSKVNDHSSFFDDIMKSDNISLLTNGIGGDGDNKKSRFASWFKKDSPEKQSRRNSLQDENGIVRHIIEFDEAPKSGVSMPPGDSDSYFAPISPAANTGGLIGKMNQANHQAGNAGKGVNIIDLLQRKQTPEENNFKQQMSGKIMKLDELEAKMRQSADMQSGISQPKQPQIKDEDMTAFRRLLAQVTGGHAVTAAANGPIAKPSAPMSLMEMLKHSQQQDEARMHHNHMLGNNPMHPIPNDITLKLQQAQQIEMLSKLMTQQQMRGTSPLQDLGLQQSRELLNRPEAQAILHGLNCGDLTPQHIHQQLSNPGLQPRHKEMLTTILKYNNLQHAGGGGMGPSPRVLSPVPPLPHHMFPTMQAQQQLRVSPLPPNAMHQRIPSPRELQIHTQNILQKALIKKKLEEQTENYRKKQEQQQRGQSPNTQANQSSTAKSVSSPTPLAFTPTSVLRKMTADKDEGKENKIDGKVPQGRALTGMRPQIQQPHPQVQQWNQQYGSLKQPAGRPIVKANPNFHQQQSSQQNAAEQFFSQHRLYNQQAQQQQNHLAQQQQQQRASAANKGQYMPQTGLSSHHPHSQYSGPNSQSSSFSSQHHLTQHQLRAQHQQRAPPASAQPTQQGVQQQTAQGHQGLPGALQQQMGYQQGNQQQTWQQFLANTQHSNRNSSIGRSSNIDGDLSPTTTNQLARWFSPDLLERARGGELPSTATLAQQVLSLEEIERQTAPPVHN